METLFVQIILYGFLAWMLVLATAAAVAGLVAIVFFTIMIIDTVSSYSMWI